VKYAQGAAVCGDLLAYALNPPDSSPPGCDRLRLAVIRCFQRVSSQIILNGLPPPVLP
jgi:hypothetical protein